jgi:hypothetical protein
MAPAAPECQPQVVYGAQRNLVLDSEYICQCAVVSPRPHGNIIANAQDIITRAQKASAGYRQRQQPAKDIARER